MAKFTSVLEITDPAVRETLGLPVATEARAIKTVTHKPANLKVGDYIVPYCGVQNRYKVLAVWYTTEGGKSVMYAVYQSIGRYYPDGTCIPPKYFRTHGRREEFNVGWDYWDPAAYVARYVEGEVR